MGKHRNNRQRSRRKGKKQATTRTLESPPPLAAFSRFSTNNDDAEGNSFHNTATKATFADVVRSKAKKDITESPTPLTEESSNSGDDDDDDSSTVTELCRINHNVPDQQPPRTAASPTVFINRTFLPGSRFDDLLVALMVHVIPQARRDRGGEWTDDERSLSTDFFRALQNGMVTALEKGRRQLAAAFDDQAIVHKVVEATCWSFQDRFDVVYYHGETGAFLHYCPLVGMTDDAWRELVQETMEARSHRTVREEQHHLDDHDCDSNEPPPQRTVEPQQVAQELDDMRTTCWECDTKSRRPGIELMVCSQCHIPRYCSQQCQAKAWATGHSIQCRSLRDTNRIMRETLGTISHTAMARSVHGVCTNPTVDFSFATLMMDPQIHGPLGIKQQWTDPQIEGPSMTFYYQNLAAIHRGDWWIFTDPCTVDDFNEVVAAKANALVTAQQRGELPHVQWLAWIQLLLTYNLQGVVDKARKAREEASAAMDAMDDSLDISALSLRMDSPTPLRMDSPTTWRVNSPAMMLNHSDRSNLLRDRSSRSMATIDNHEMDSAAIEALLHPESWIHRYRIFYGVSMPPEALLKFFTLDKPHDLSIEAIKTHRDFAKWFVYQDLRNVYHK